MNLLLVDDEPMVLGLLEERTAKVLPNATISSFTNAKSALTFAESNHIDIAFLDINMRVLDGIAIAKHLQAINSKINIIFCTGYTEYMQDAWEMYCSGYLVKPVTEQKIRKAVENLRYPINEKRVSFKCFGNFEVYCDGKPIRFKYNRAKELLAYLVDRNGAECTTRELIAVLFEDDFNREYFKQLRRDLISTFDELGIANVLNINRGTISINTELVECDYYDYLKSNKEDAPTEYMSQYSFGEQTFAGF